MKRDVIIACDFSDKKTTLEFLDQFTGRKPFVKIGMELFYAEGPEMVREIKARDHQIFLDLKLHDIPNTVYKAMKNVVALGVDLTNVHALGGIEMMQAAQKAVNEVNPATKLIAVTQLTSTSEENMQKELGISMAINDSIAQLARNARTAGLAGVVCSPLEAGLVKDACGEGFLTVTPGIRFADDAASDQKRITTPLKAKEIGSSYIVVGRSITGAKDPVAAYERCMKEFAED